MHVFCTLDWFILYTISTFGEWNCAFWYYVTIIIVRTVKWNARSFTFWPQHLIIQEMRREKWCCFSERSSNLLTIANCYLYCKTNNEDNEVLWGYFVVTTKLPHTCRSYSSFWMIKTLKDGAKYATSTFPIMHLICPPKFGITICDFQSESRSFSVDMISEWNFIRNENWNDFNTNKMSFGYHVNKYREIYENWMTSF